MNSNAALVICALLLLEVSYLSQAQPTIGNKRPYRGTGGWTMNSIGYNAGLDALQKIFGKRDGISDTDMTLDVGEDNIRAILDEFISFLELKESGLLRPSLVHCLRSEIGSAVAK